MGSKLAAITAAITTVAVLAAPAAAKGPKTDLEFLGQAIVASGTTFEGTRIGGLSSITYDARLGVFYAVSDDPADVRYYTLRLDPAGPDVTFEDVTRLQAPGGGPYAAGSLDPEGLALTKDRELIFTSEGIANNGVAPFVRRYELDGTFIADLPVPVDFSPTATRASGNDRPGARASSPLGDGWSWSAPRSRRRASRSSFSIRSRSVTSGPASRHP